MVIIFEITETKMVPIRDYGAGIIPYPMKEFKSDGEANDWCDIYQIERFVICQVSDSINFYVNDKPEIKYPSRVKSIGESFKE